MHALRDARPADEFRGFPAFDHFLMDAFHRVSDGAEHCGEVFEDEAANAFTDTLDESKGAVIAGATVGLEPEACDAIVDAEDEFVASGIETGFDPCDSDGGSDCGVAV